MFDIEDSTINGFYFKSLQGCSGIGVCNKCGESIEVTCMKDIDNLNDHKCKESKSE